MLRRLPPLVAVRAFESFARHGSVRAAADELSVSHTVVSRHIQNLEAAIETKLVRKAGRGLILTEHGKQFSRQLHRAFGMIADATRELHQHSRGELHICCMAGLASRCLLHRLPALQERLCDVHITLEPVTTRSDFSRSDADAEIFYLENEPDGEDLRAEMFARPRILAVASPDFKARHPGVHSPEDLVALQLIHERSTKQWETWLQRAGVQDPRPLRGPHLWHGHLTFESARLGHGVALISELVAAQGVAAGDLVEMVPSSVRLGRYYFIAPAHRWDDANLQYVRQWLLETFPDPRLREP